MANDRNEVQWNAKEMVRSPKSSHDKSASAKSDPQIFQSRKSSAAKSSESTNGNIKRDASRKVDHFQEKVIRNSFNDKQVSPERPSPEKAQATNGVLKSPPSPTVTPSRYSPSRSPQRSSRDTTTPNALRTLTNSTSRSSPRRSPFKREETHSPSQQLQEEFARFHLDSQVAFTAKLDRKSEQLAQQHNQALAEAAIKHEEVLQSAQKAREKLQLQLENEVIRRRLMEAEEVERIRKEKIALEEAEQQRKLDAAKALEKEAQRRRDHARATAEAEDRARKESERLTTEARQREEDANRSRLAQQTAQKHKEQQQEAEERAKREALAQKSTSSAPSVVAPTASTLTRQSGDVSLMQWSTLEIMHSQYIDLHRRLKTMRKDVMAAYKQAKGNTRSQIAQLADMRRSLAKLLGQFTSDKAKNKSIRNQVEQIMATAWNITDIALDAKDFVLQPTNPWPTNGNSQVSGVFIYLVNILTKAAIQSMGAASRQTAYNAVDYYGVVLSWIVSNSKFRLHGNSFADIIIAKFHASCPPLFGVYGPENTAQGRKRLGWHEEDNSQEHFDKVNALAIGWGALTLRDYTRLAGENSAIPAWHYWQSLACVVNVPPAELTKTHGIILKGLVDQYAHLFIKFYGQAAIVALRRALVQLPDEAPEAAGFDKVKVVRDNLYSRLKLRL